MPKAPATEDYFAGRTEIINSIITGIYESKHYLLLGPRKVGKSSILESLVRKINDNGKMNLLIPIRIRCTEHENFEAVIVKMMDELWKQKQLGVEKIIKYMRIVPKRIREYLERGQEYRKSKMDIEKEISIETPLLGHIRKSKTHYRIEETKKTIKELSKDFFWLMNKIFNENGKRILFLIDELGFTRMKQQDHAKGEIWKALYFWDSLVQRKCPHPIIAAASRNPIWWADYKSSPFHIKFIGPFEENGQENGSESLELIQKFERKHQNLIEDRAKQNIIEKSHRLPYALTYFLDWLKENNRYANVENHKFLWERFMQDFSKTDIWDWNNTYGSENLAALRLMAKTTDPIIPPNKDELIADGLITMDYDRGRYVFVDKFLRDILAKYW